MLEPDSNTGVLQCGYMKTVKCADLGGPSTCTVEIPGATVEEMGKNCQEHVMEEIEKGDSDHQDAVEAMQSLAPEEQQEMYAKYMQVCEEALKG